MFTLKVAELTWPVLVSLFGVGVVALRYLVARRRTEDRLERKGRHAPSVPSRFPLGLDVALEACRRMMSHEFLDWTGNILQNKGWTVELQMLNTRVVLTENPENIKAVLSTQVSATDLSHGICMPQGVPRIRC